MDFLELHAQEAKRRSNHRRREVKRSEPHQYRKYCRSSKRDALLRVRVLRLRWLDDDASSLHLDLSKNKEKTETKLDLAPQNTTATVTIHYEATMNHRYDVRNSLCTCEKVILKLPHFVFEVPRNQGSVGDLRSVPGDSIMYSFAFLDVQDLAALSVVAKGLSLICSDNSFWERFCQEQLNTFAATGTEDVLNWRMEYKWRKQRKRQARLWRLNMSMGRVGRLLQITRPQGCGFSYYGSDKITLASSKIDELQSTNGRDLIAAMTCPASDACIRKTFYTYASEMKEVTHTHVPRALTAPHVRLDHT